MTDTDRSADGEPTGSADSGAPADDVTPEDVPEFGDLSILQRGFVAAAQNPSRGLLVVGLLVFALAFYAAFWFSYPRAAGFLSAIAAIVIVAAAVVYWLLDRVAR